MHPATLSPDSESHSFNGREIFQKERVKQRPSTESATILESGSMKTHSTFDSGACGKREFYSDLSHDPVVTKVVIR